MDKSNSTEQNEARVTWLYFMEGMTQSEVARKLGTTRLRVNRIIVEARQSGLIHIELNSRFKGCVELEQELIGDFGLRNALVIPTPQEEDMLPMLLGQAAAKFVGQFLRENPIGGFGIGWGQTQREMVRHMPSGKYPDLRVNSVMGGITCGIEVNTFNIASELARRLHAKCEYLAAPIYAGSAESRDVILHQDIFLESFRRMKDNELVILGVGDITKRSMLVRLGLPMDVNVSDLVTAGAASDVCGHFLDKHGDPIDHPLNKRVIAMPLDDLKRVPNVVLAAGGQHKVQAVASVLNAELASVLICDEATARDAAKLARENR